MTLVASSVEQTYWQERRNHRISRSQKARSLRPTNQFSMKFSQLKQASKKGENIRFPGSQDKSSRVTHSTTDSLLEDSNRENQDQAQAKQKVEHNYHDHARDKVITKEKLTVAKPTDLDTSSSGRGQTSKRVRGGCVRVFPEALYNMLAVSDGTRMSKHNEETSATSAPTGTTNGGGFENIISWLPHGRSFLIRNPDEFVRTIMPRFFHQSKITSFQRQLNLYGFTRMSGSRDRGAYYHELFLRGRPDLCTRMYRQKIKGNGPKAIASPEKEPNFYEMVPCSYNDQDKIDTSNARYANATEVDIDLRLTTLIPSYESESEVDDNDESLDLTESVGAVRDIDGAHVDGNELDNIDEAYTKIISDSVYCEGLIDGHEMEGALALSLSGTKSDDMDYEDQIESESLEQIENFCYETNTCLFEGKSEKAHAAIVTPTWSLGSRTVFPRESWPEHLCFSHWQENDPQWLPLKSFHPVSSSESSALQQFCSNRNVHPQESLKSEKPLVNSTRRFFPVFPALRDDLLSLSHSPSIHPEVGPIVEHEPTANADDIQDGDMIWFEGHKFCFTDGDDSKGLWV